MLTLRQWIAREEDIDIERVNWLLLELITHDRHDGDCTKQAHPCNLCALENYLSGYYEYMETQLLKENKS